jgi:hypothetical protein
MNNRGTITASFSSSAVTPRRSSSLADFALMNQKGLNSASCGSG